MRYNAKSLAELLPAIHRLRDTEHTNKDQPLKELVELLAEQIRALEENLHQLYDDQFIETCADWAVPYIADLVGCRLLDEKVEGLVGRRAEVANTIGYRRRKGTASMLELLAHDVTGWDARVVEFFERLATTQHMNHIRPENLALTSLKSASPLETQSTPFEPLAHTGEVRAIASRRGKYNIPNIGIFLWRLKACSLTSSSARPAVVSGTPDKRRFFFSALGHDLPLVTSPQPEGEIAHLAEPLNVPLPIGRRLLRDHLEDYYGPKLSIFVKGIDHPADIIVADLSDRSSADDWGPAPGPGIVAVDPVLGRLVFGDDKTDPPLVTFYYGFGADMGGGEYDRQLSFNSAISKVIQVPDDQPTIQKAFQAMSDEDTVIEITDNGIYRETLTKTFPAGKTVEIRSANEKRPLVELQAPFEIKGSGADVTLNGLMVSGEKIVVSGKVKALRIRHCTLVPGLVLKPSCEPEKSGEPSLEVRSETAELEVDHSITGGLRLAEEGIGIVADSVLDATDESGVALAAADGKGAAGVVKIIRSTVIGKVHVVFLKLACNSIFYSALKLGDGWAAPVVSKKLQDGCVRFSFIPWDSRVPKKHRCRPGTIDEAERIRPRFTTVRYGRPGYAQLHWLCPCVIRRGADDGSEMGAFHDLYSPQREANLRVRLEEYLRFGLEAGIFYAS